MSPFPPPKNKKKSKQRGFSSSLMRVHSEALLAAFYERELNSDMMALQTIELMWYSLLNKSHLNLLLWHKKIFVY